MKTWLPLLTRIALCAGSIALLSASAHAAEVLPGSVDNGDGTWTYRYAPSGGANDGTDQGGPETGKDTAVLSFSPDSAAQADAESVQIYWSTCNTWQAWAFFRFDLTGLPPAEDVSLVQFVFYNQIQKAYSGYQVATTTYDLHQATEDWDEMTATWNSKPAVTASSDAHVAIATTQVRSPTLAYDDYVAMDITQLYKDWVNAVHSNHGLAIRRREMFCENGNANRVTSSDAEAADKRPALVITYQGPSAAEDAGVSDASVEDDAGAGDDAAVADAGVDAPPTMPDGAIRDAVPEADSSSSSPDAATSPGTDDDGCSVQARSSEAAPTLPWLLLLALFWCRRFRADCRGTRAGLGSRCRSTRRRSRTRNGT